MNAQEKWKRQYRGMSHCTKCGFFYEAHEHRMMAADYRREAALERKLEAAQRRIAELEPIAQRAIDWVKDTGECLFCYVEEGKHEDFCPFYRDSATSDSDARLLEQWHERM